LASPLIWIKGNQSGHHHHPTHQMIGMLEHECAKYEVHEVRCLITLNERYTWTDRNHTCPEHIVWVCQ